jgi:hypothetical protein
MSIGENLYRLQLLDSKIDTSRKQIFEIDQHLQGSPALAHARSEMTEIEQTLRSATTDLKMAELEVQSLDEKINGEEKRLYEGKIKNPKELIDVQAELDMLKKRRVGMDDKLLILMERVESLQSDEARVRKALREAEENFKSDEIHLQEERTRLISELTGIAEQRHALCATLTKKHLDQYIEIRAKRSNGIAVVIVKSNACGACGEVLASHLLQLARQAEDVALCSNCGRILHSP